MPYILFIGGGSIGHLAPSLAVWQAVKNMVPDSKALFVCAKREEEMTMLRESGMDYVTLNAPKFPRGMNWHWITFSFQMIAALFDSFRILRSRPSVIFSKGGYVSTPVCLVAWMKGIPIVLHESDSVTGLSNRLIGKFATNTCLGFPPHNSRLKTPSFAGAPAGRQDSRLIVTGNPVRSEILTGSRDAGYRITGFSGKRPIIMIIGGSQGAQSTNEAVEEQFDALIALGDLIHLTGAGKEIRRSHARCWSRPFVREELPHLYALADVVITRAGMGVLSELASLKKPAIVIPLRGLAQDHQWKNAKHLHDAGAIRLLSQEEMATLTSVIQSLLNDTSTCRMLGEKLHETLPANAAERIADVIIDVVKNSNS